MAIYKELRIMCDHATCRATGPIVGSLNSHQLANKARKEARSVGFRRVSVLRPDRDPVYRDLCPRHLAQYKAEGHLA